MPYRIQDDTLRDELQQIKVVLEKWQDKMAGGIPGNDLPADEMNAEIFQYQLRGELNLLAERLLALVEVLE